MGGVRLQALPMTARQTPQRPSIGAANAAERRHFSRSSPVQRTDNPLSHDRVSFFNHGETVCPTGPKRGVTRPRRASAQAAQREWDAGDHLRLGSVGRKSAKFWAGGGRSGGRRSGGGRSGGGVQSRGGGGSVGQNRPGAPKSVWPKIGQAWPKLAKLKVVAKVCLAVAEVGLAVAKVGLATEGGGQSRSGQSRP